MLNAARVRLNDAILSIGGDVLTNAQPFTQQIANNAWRRLQNYLANLGYSRLRSEVAIALPAVTSVDPASAQYINWTQCYDGSNFQGAPVLPQDLIVPARLWERVTGMNAPWTPMEAALDGLPARPKAARNFVWEWRGDAIFLPGSLLAMDLRIRYQAYLPDFITAGNVNWFNQLVPIMYALDPLANYICAETASARGDLDAQSFVTLAEAGAAMIYNRDVQLKQRVNVRRLPRSGRFDY